MELIVINRKNLLAMGTVMRSENAKTQAEQPGSFVSSVCVVDCPLFTGVRVPSASTDFYRILLFCLLLFLIT